MTTFAAMVIGLAAFFLSCQGSSSAQSSERRDIERPATGLITGLKGQLHAMVQPHQRDGRPLRLGDRIATGDVLRTGPDGYVELVWERRAFIAVREASQVILEELQDGHTHLRLKEGGVRVALAYRAGRPTDIVTVLTSTSRVMIRGGIIEVDVSPPSSLLTFFARVKDVFARMTSERQGPGAEIIKVIEGQARIESLASESTSQLVDARSQVLLLAGSIADLTELPMQETGLRLSAVQQESTPALIRQRIVGTHRQHALEEEDSIPKAGAADEFPSATQPDLRGAVLSTSLGIRPGTPSPSGAMTAAQPAPIPPIPSLVPTQSGGINSEILLRDILRGGRD